MAADVDKTPAENGRNVSNRTERQSPGSGSWLCRGLWTVLLVGAVPLVALGVKYYQDAQLVKRHVRFFFLNRNLVLIPTATMFYSVQRRERG